MGEHISSETIERYVEHKLNEDEVLKVEEHLSRCEECARRLRAAWRFNFLWERWTAEAHGEAYRKVLALGWKGRLALALTGLSLRRRELRQRLMTWLDRVGSKAGAAFELVLDRGRQAARIALEEAVSLLPSESPWQFRPALVRGAPRTRGLLRGEESRTLVADGPPGARVSVDPGKGRVTVWIDELPPGRKPPLVLLVPKVKGAEPAVEVPAGREGRRGLWAEFTDVPDGEYLLVIEPLG